MDGRSSFLGSRPGSANGSLIHRLSCLQVILVADDTAVWVNNTAEKVTVKENGNSGDEGNGDDNVNIRKKEQVGMKRTSPLLGMLQQICLKRSDGTIDCVSLHSPSQLLPRQNAGTILNRIRRWALYSSSGCSEWLGGEELYELFRKVPLKMLIWCPGLICTTVRIFYCTLVLGFLTP